MDVRNNTRRFSLSILPICAGLLCILLTGCTLQNTALPDPVQGAAFGGKLMGGQQPVTGATVYIVATGTSGYGNAPLGGGLLAQTTSDGSGNFAFPAGSYTCPSSTLPILIEARSGNPGLTAGTLNTAIFMVAALGPCGALTPSTFVIINEVTTVAAAYTLRPFMNGNNIGVPSSNAAGLSNAILTYNNLVNNARGTAPGAAVPAGAAIPTLVIHSLANSLAACINSSDVTSTACQNLFTDAQTATSGTTANTFVAAAGIASHPGLNATAIYNLAGSTPPFQPALTSAPLDWTIPIVYTSGLLKQAAVGIDVDASGNVFVATTGGFAGTVEELSNSGTLVRSAIGNTVIDGPTSLAIDTLGRIAVTSATSGDQSVLLFDSSNNLVSYYQNSTNLVTPNYVSFDASNRMIVSDSGSNKILAITPATSGNPGTLNTVVAEAGGPTGAQSDGSGNIWVSNTNIVQIERYAGGLTGTRGIYNNASFSVQNGQFSFDNTGLAYAGGSGIYQIAFTNTNPPAYSARASNISSSNSPINKGYRVDGLNGTWIALGGYPVRLIHYTAGFVDEYGVYYTSGNAAPAGLAIDRSGNVWLASNTLNVGLTEVVGAAAPVVTPVMANVVNNTFGTRP